MKPQSENAQARIRAWVSDVLTRTGWSGHKLARAAGVSPSTIHRILKDDQFVTATRTIDKIATASGVSAPPDLIGHAPPAAGFREPEAVYEGPPPPGRGHNISPHAAVWRLQSWALQLAGCLPGDLLTVDPDATPQAGDIVCIQSVNPASGEAETLFRVFEPPCFAVVRTAAPDMAQKPLMLDGDANQVWGVVMRVERNTRA